MKITKQYLKQVIKEELEKLNEMHIPYVLDWYFIRENSRQMSLIGNIALPQGGVGRATIPIEKVEKTVRPNEFLTTSESGTKRYIHIEDANKGKFWQSRQFLIDLGVMNEKTP